MGQARSPRPRQAVSPAATHLAGMSIEEGATSGRFAPGEARGTGRQKRRLDSNAARCFYLGQARSGRLATRVAADKRTLIRRVTFDLTGLPPTPDEIAAFLADDSADAWTKSSNAC